jgi:ABC-type microcin C transport system permease subunit YejB
VTSEKQYTPVVARARGRCITDVLVFYLYFIVLAIAIAGTCPEGLVSIYISGSACSTVGVHSQAWSTSGIGRLGSKSGRG